MFKVLTSLIVILFSSPSFAQSIECQMLRDDILSERRQQQQQQQQQSTQYGSPGSMGNPSLAPFYAQAAQQGQLIGQGAGALMGVPNLQQKIQIYKQKCE